MTFFEFVASACAYASAHPSQRVGQAFMNHLQAKRPDLWHDVSFTPSDPFYTEDRVPAFLQSLQGVWGPSIPAAPRVPTKKRGY